MTFKEKISHLIESGFQAIYIPTGERSRCEDELQIVAEQLQLQLITWDGVNGFSDDNDCKDPLEAMMSMDEDENPRWKDKEVIFVMRNMHIYLEDPAVRQMFQNLYFSRKFSNKNYRRPMLILAGIQQIHQEILPCVTVTEFSLPTEEELAGVFDMVAASIEVDVSRPGATATYDDEMRSRAIQAMRGLTTLEAENVFCYGLRLNRGFAETLIDTIEDQKAQAIEKSEILTYTPKDRILTMDQIGGYEELKSFVSERKLSYTKKARELEMDLPRGIVLLGVPGTGKSVVGKVIARELGLPLVVLNVGAIFGSLVGESERRIRTALSTVDALDGAVVLVDEAEKALGGASQSTGDSGVAQRVFGTILTWLTEKKSRTFVVMTMNRTRGIPPEFLRKGRFDEIFYTDIPDDVERAEILRIHCQKRKVDIKAYKADEWEALVAATNNCVGSELEQIVLDARFKSFAARGTGQPTLDELIQSVPVAPIAVAEAENIADIREKCIGCARPVSKQRQKVNGPKKGRTVNLI